MKSINFFLFFPRSLYCCISPPSSPPVAPSWGIPPDLPLSHCIPWTCACAADNDDDRDASDWQRGYQGWIIAKYIALDETILWYQKNKTMIFPSESSFINEITRQIPTTTSTDSLNFRKQIYKRRSQTSIRRPPHGTVHTTLTPCGRPSSRLLPRSTRWQSSTIRPDRRTSDDRAANDPRPRTPILKYLITKVIAMMGDYGREVYCSPLTIRRWVLYHFGIECLPVVVRVALELPPATYRFDIQHPNTRVKYVQHDLQNGDYLPQPHYSPSAWITAWFPLQFE